MVGLAQALELLIAELDEEKVSLELSCVVRGGDVSGAVSAHVSAVLGRISGIASLSKCWRRLKHAALTAARIAHGHRQHAALNLTVAALAAATVAGLLLRLARRRVRSQVRRR